MSEFFLISYKQNGAWDTYSRDTMGTAQSHFVDYKKRVDKQQMGMEACAWHKVIFNPETGELVKGVMEVYAPVQKPIVEYNKPTGPVKPNNPNKANPLLEDSMEPVPAYQNGPYTNSNTLFESFINNPTIGALEMHEPIPAPPVAGGW